MSKRDSSSVASSISRKSDHRSLLETVGNGSEEAYKKRENELLDKTIVEFPKNQTDGVTAQTKYLDLSNIVNTKINVKSFPSKLVVLRLTGTKIPQLSEFPQLDYLRTLYLDHCNLTSLEGLPRFSKLRYLYLNDNSIKNYQGISIYPELTLLDLSNNPGKFTAESALQATGSIRLSIFNGIAITRANIRQAFKSPIVGIALRSGLNPENATEQEATEFLSSDIIQVCNDLNLDIALARITFKQTEDNNYVAEMPIPLTDRPEENHAYDIKWYMSSCPFLNQKGEEWEEIKMRTQENSITILNIMHQHIIKATFKLYLPNSKDPNKVYSMYASQVVGYQKGQLVLPFPVDPIVCGEPREGTLISVMPMPIPSRTNWYIDTDLILENSETLNLTYDHVGKVIKCVIQPYCTELPDERFNELETETEVVQPLLPSVTGLSFPKEVIEGQQIKFTRQILPDREGDSEITIERAKTASDEWVECTTLNPSSLVYTPTKNDVNCFLRLKYLPVLQDGSSIDEPQIFYSKERVIPALPSFKNQRICGDFFVGRKVIAIADYEGGEMGECHFQWYSSQKEIKSKSEVTKCKKLRTTSQILELGESELNRYVVCLMTPIRDDDVSGEEVFCCSEKTIETDENPPEKINLPKEIFAFKPISIDFYSRWFVSSTEDEESFESAGTGQIFTPNLSHVGRFLRIKSEKGDYILDIVKPSAPLIVNGFELITKSDELKDGDIIEIPDEIETENCEIVWIRNQNGKAIVVDVESRSYKIQESDVGYTIKCGVTPQFENSQIVYSKSTTKISKAMRQKPKIVKLEDGNLSLNFEGTVYSMKWFRSRDKVEFEHICSFVFSGFDRNTESENYTLFVPQKNSKENLQKVKENLDVSELSYKITDADTNCYMKCEVELGNLQVVKGQTVVKPSGEVISATTKSFIKAPDFLLYFDRIPDSLRENEKITLQVKGSLSQIPKYYWLLKTVDEETNEDSWTVISDCLSFIPNKEHIGCQIRAVATTNKYKIDDLFKENLPENQILDMPEIKPSLPIVKDINISQDDKGKIVITANYIGGKPSKPLVILGCTGSDGVTIEEKSVNEQSISIENDDKIIVKLTPWREMFFGTKTPKINVCITPVRDDGLKGKPVWSNTTAIVKKVTHIDKIRIANGSKNKEQKVGDVLMCKVVPFEGENDEIDHCEFEWTFETEINDHFTSLFEDQISKLTKKKSKSLLSDSDDEDDTKSDILTLKQTDSENNEYELIYDQSENKVRKFYSRRQMPSIILTEDDSENRLTVKVWVINKYGFETSKTSHLKIQKLGQQDLIPELLINVKNKKKKGDKTDDDSQVYTDSILTCSFVNFDNENNDDLTWFVCQNENYEDEEEIICDDSFTPNAMFCNKFVFAKCGELKSNLVGPVLPQQKVETLAKSYYKSGTLKFKGDAPVGNGIWDVSFTLNNIVLTGRNNVTKSTEWKSVNIVIVDNEKIKIETGPGMKYLMIPNINKDFSQKESCDLCYLIFQKYINSPPEESLQSPSKVSTKRSDASSSVSPRSSRRNDNHSVTSSPRTPRK
ncbi:Leucine Rich Repeat family protein [Trichomonas vaginalis G3]|uniref:Leucine Rich Repeat family protein n=1 Tax=Trichomonas vaginalis (strain ATCC PRA-98 / G3) TaxID=412133 RepID=A2F7L7_TRIV3|nr:uncharacterized protein TVAGG3_0909470 [Trichomonas vaginalis G3]EAX99086.1 Leucine Rich Repeat family protein [Trichomonas vaginalis G3]KAI5484315.1 acidic leucine-rich nuclear phosphoprotein 32 family [Trichomonas vaginalis G3]|eukprot:XP_001312016.1 hypothetical protein [Trichomonas vaginalis G3]